MMPIMTKRIITLFAALAATGLLFTASPANAAGATKVNLLASAGGSCSTGASIGVPTGGFAIIHATGSGKIVAELSLKNLTPNHTYDVALVQTPDGSDCFTPDVTVTTNGNGNGNVNIQEDRRAGTTGAFILVQPSDVNNYIASSPLVTLG